MQRLERYDMQTLWDDRVLGHAFALEGGVPRVELVDADGSVPSRVLAPLGSALQLPARA